MLTEEQINENRLSFLKLIAEIDIDGADTQGLVDFLDNNDFFTAPASTIYHANYEGGLCAHSLNVFHTLEALYEKYKSDIPKYDRNSLLIVGLLHDISKVNFYEKSTVNKKIYSDKGLKKDNQGKFDWFAEEVYRVKDAKTRELLGNHEEASMLTIGRFIPLQTEEIIAIMYHHCNMNNGAQFYDLSAHLNRYPLLALLHAADFLSCFILERDA